MSRSSLEAGIRMLQDDRDNGARVLATRAVSILKDILVENEKDCKTREDLWLSLRFAAWKLRYARPSMHAAISSALVQALTRMKDDWDHILQGEAWSTIAEEKHVEILVRVGISSLKSTIESRTVSVEAISGHFTAWMTAKSKELRRPTRTLTLSYSSSLMACLEAVFRDSPELQLDLRVLESRPRCEGAAFAIALTESISRDNVDSRWSISVATDSSLAMLSKDVDIVLLGADCISSSGDVSNKMGSLAVVICAKTLSPNCQVVVVADSDKITPGASDIHAVEENDTEEVYKIWSSSLPAGFTTPKGISVRNVYFEWVPVKFVDLYINEIGQFDKQDVKRSSAEIEARERLIFDAEATGAEL